MGWRPYVLPRFGPCAEVLLCMLAGLPGWCHSSPGEGWPVSVYWVEWPSQIWPDHLDVIWREVEWPSDRCSMPSKMVVSAHIYCWVCWWEWDRTELDANVLSIRTGWDPSSLRYHWGGLRSALRQRGCYHQHSKLGGKYWEDKRTKYWSLWFPSRKERRLGLFSLLCRVEGSLWTLSLVK